MPLQLITIIGSTEGSFPKSSAGVRKVARQSSLVHSVRAVTPVLDMVE
ncbi:hypothetical protein [Mesorhizobium sp. M5C.F.Ca.IN.020.32.2.1]|nr:hypothetical protein [Mesorhizobium sp. M5C.F.Ca.IN.020.32.2.1]